MTSVGFFVASVDCSLVEALSVVGTVSAVGTFLAVGTVSAVGTSADNDIVKPMRMNAEMVQIRELPIRVLPIKVARNDIVGPQDRVSLSILGLLREVHC